MTSRAASWSRSSGRGRRTAPPRGCTCAMTTRTGRTGCCASVTTGYTYEAHSDRLVGVTQNGASRLRYSYDGLGRLSGRTLYLPGGGTVNAAYGYVPGAGSQATTALLGWYDNGFTRNTYGYDSRGNLIYDGQTATGVAASNTPGLQYVYDDLNQLIRINDVAGGKTYTYTYDNRGNLRQKNEYALSTGELGTPTRTVDYGYGNADWQDQLTSYNGSAITYDAIGNPTIWYDGMQMTWQKGRQLTGINSPLSGTTMYTYDDSGLRTSKTMNGVKTEYYRSGSRLIGQKQGSNVMQLLYDANGLYGFLYNGTPHYYVYNGQGDVVRLISASGATEAMYTYDAWGKILSVTDGSGSAVSDASHIANVNPIRYRCYYYDVETDFYYVQSRYYDPLSKRFVSADDADYLGTDGSVLGYNLFTYCGNNPVNQFDVNGNWSMPNWAKIAIGAAAIAVGVIATAATGGAAVPVLVASLKIAATSAAIGAVSGAGISAVNHRVSTGSWEGAGKAAVTGAIEGACDGFMWGGITAGASFTTVAAKGIKVKEIGKLKPSNKPGDGYSGVKYQSPKANGKYTTKSIELHSPHKSGPHNVWHWQQNTWNPYNNSITGSAKQWTIWGKML